MSEKTYKIKKLEWEGNDPKFQNASFLNGSFTVKHDYWPYEEGDEELEDLSDTWNASYCFADWHDEGSHFDFKTIEEAKDWCQQEALKRILTALEEL